MPRFLTRQTTRLPCRPPSCVARAQVERLIKAVKRVPKVEASAVGSETFAASGTVDEEGRERILKDLRRARGALAVLRGDTENAELGMLERSEHQAEGGHGRCETQVKRALRTSGVALRICGITVLGIVELIFCCSYGRFEDM